jgi:A/G-specific adenine glycosylase
VVAPSAPLTRSVRSARKTRRSGLGKPVAAVGAEAGLEPAVPDDLPPGLVPSLAQRIIAWHSVSGRHDLPWQRSRDPYAVWVSEIMLQQTQVSTVIGYYERFMQAFPDVQTLANSSLDEVLRLWSGLGYYSRARNLHRCAQIVVSEHAGRFPGTAEMLARLPGVGPSTAAAIAAFCFGERVAILDGNVKRVLCRVFGVEGFPGRSAVQRTLWRLAQRELPEPAVLTDPSTEKLVDQSVDQFVDDAAGKGASEQASMQAWTQGLMDLGATVCTPSRPACPRCPVQDACVALASGRVAQLPTPRPRRTIPSREALVWIVRFDDQVLLQKREPSGVWGGLWSLPQTSPQVDGLEPPSWLGVGDAKPSPLASFEHVFTHFRLRLHPRQVWVAEPAAVQAPESVTWRFWSLSQLSQAGLPQPIRRLLQGLSAS